MTKRTITTLLLLVSGVTTYAGAQAPGRDSAAEATIRALDDQERLAALNQDYAARSVSGPNTSSSIRR